MKKYGQAAVDAVLLLHQYMGMHPAEAWETATLNVFKKGAAAQKKGCPKNAFLGLCEEGLVKGIPAGHYCYKKRSKDKIICY